ncbi:NAD(P)H-binding protein [Ottowia sp.]|uniref:NAD(P)H-binding protein n=1 Tax=Ottowia sp. TaxID=1898956 RepID=UPI0025DBBE1A|nr:NAD(P)H-binding protein [Ottowia sp.]
MTSRRVAVAGATGLVGRCLVQQLCAEPAVAAVHGLARRPLGWTHPKLHMHVVDFAALPALPPVDEVYLALGTTIRQAGNQAAFRAVDFDANLAVARAAQAAGAGRAGLVSAMGANAKSSVFYSRVKGELEDALAALGFDALVIARPSMLRGDRAVLGQPVRAGELRWARLDALLRPLIPSNYRAIDAADVAAALCRQVPTAQGRVVLPSGAMQGASLPASQ